MSFIGRLLGSDKAVEKTIETAGRIIDEAWYSKDEQATDRAEARREAQGMVMDWMRSTTGQHLSRRLIALSITGSWLFMHMLSSFLAIGAIWSDSAVKLTASSQLIDSRLDNMTGAVMLILGFYFAAPYLGDIAKNAIDRFGK